MEHKELEEKVEKEVNYSKPLMSMPMIFELFLFTRLAYPVKEPIKAKEKENYEPHFDMKNLERDNTKAKDTGMKKEPKRKHNEDVNPKMLESSRKAFNKRVAYKRTRLKMMENGELTLPPETT
ncbi:unnamed protein product [Lactuca virosa]|uniref:Uncharacterized protein n=1 Tax=Lactuca virosa TaxID=75947 RepID=A0AAU9NW02_9ASTR|nr:unnamed protein product [Lactuca virosa]